MLKRIELNIRPRSENLRGVITVSYILGIEPEELIRMACF